MHPCHRQTLPKIGEGRPDEYIALLTKKNTLIELSVKLPCNRFHTKCRDTDAGLVYSGNFN